MEAKTIDKATSDNISFMAYIVPAFAEADKMNVQDAFFYLKKYGGWTSSTSIGGHCIPTARFTPSGTFMKYAGKTGG